VVKIGQEKDDRGGRDDSPTAFDEGGGFGQACLGEKRIEHVNLHASAGHSRARTARLSAQWAVTRKRGERGGDRKQSETDMGHPARVRAVEHLTDHLDRSPYLERTKWISGEVAAKQCRLPLGE